MCVCVRTCVVFFHLSIYDSIVTSDNDLLGGWALREKLKFNQFYHSFVNSLVVSN